MAYPYKKMDEDDFAYIRSVTADDRVWVGEAQFYNANSITSAIRQQPNNRLDT